MHSTRSVILCALLMTIFVDGITASGEYHANEGGKFSAFKSQADFAEKQLRKTLNLMPEDEVHTASVAMQVGKEYLRDISFDVHSYIICLYFIYLYGHLQLRMYLYFYKLDMSLNQINYINLKCLKIKVSETFVLGTNVP